MSNVEGMYSVYFIKKKKAGINPATTKEPQSKSSGGVYPRPVPPRPSVPAACLAAGFHAKPDDPSILIIKGGSYPRPTLPTN